MKNQQLQTYRAESADMEFRQVNNGDAFIGPHTRLRLIVEKGALNLPLPFDPGETDHDASDIEMRIDFIAAIGNHLSLHALLNLTQALGEEAIRRSKENTSAPHWFNSTAETIEGLMDSLAKAEPKNAETRSNSPKL